MNDISLKAFRDQLTVRREPYWQKLEKGEALGFRRGSDTWIARYRDRTGVYRYRALPHLEDYRDAARQARAWFKQMATPAARVARRGTIKQALLAYVDDLRQHNRGPAADRALGMFKTVVWSDRLAGMRLETLDQEDMMAWRERITSGRQARTVNRYVRAVAAGLNRALQRGWVGPKEAWQLRRLTDEVEERGDTAVFLTKEQRAAILAACDPAARAFFAMLELTGARPREIAATTVGEFHPGPYPSQRLVHHKGKPPKARKRDVVLSQAAIELVQTQAAGRAACELLFPGPGGVRWQRDVWARAFRAAVRKAALPPGQAIPRRASAYSFRHARISELLQEGGLDPISVASQTGTSVAMIEKHYLKFIPTAYREKLANLK